MTRKASFDQYLQIGRMMKEGALDNDTAQAIIEKRFAIIPNPEESRLLDSTLVASERPLVMGPFRVKIDLSMSDVEMIRSAQLDNEDSAMRELTEERFPIQRNGLLQYEKDLYLVAPSKEGMLTRPWQRERRKNQWIDERLPEMLALAAYFPDLQRETDIIACFTSRHVPGGRFRLPELWCNVGERMASVTWCDVRLRRWGSRHRALVSRKQDLEGLVT